MDGWTRWQKREPSRLAWRSPYINHQRGSASTLDEKAGVVQVRHVVGFAREDWGEGNWTARDLR